MTAPMFVSDNVDDNLALGREQIKDYILFGAVFVTFLCSFILCIYHQPDKLPSRAAAECKRTEFRFKEDLQELFANKNYRWILVCYMIAYGYYTGMAALLDAILQPYHMTSSSVSIIGVCFILSGIIGSFIFSAYLDRTKKFLKTLKFILIGMLVSVSCSLFTLPSKSFTLILINCAVSGFFTISIIPVAFAFSVELTHPISEPMSNGVMIILSQIVGIICCYLGTALSKMNPLYCIAMFMI